MRNIRGELQWELLEKAREDRECLGDSSSREEAQKAVFRLFGVLEEYELRGDAKFTFLRSRKLKVDFDGGGSTGVVHIFFRNPDTNEKILHVGIMRETLGFMLANLKGSKPNEFDGLFKKYKNSLNNLLIFAVSLEIAEIVELLNEALDSRDSVE
ncbi:MAG: hypothetical protein ACOX2O_01460 [Bdellovibrionota bacterium]|jgi:hypothetical protein